MLIRASRATAWAALAMLLLGACSEQPAPRQTALTAEAGYRLLFNGEHVGNALFVLQTHADASYRIEAFTIPVAQDPPQPPHELLESSHGLMAEDGIRPLRFEHSVLQAQDLQLIELIFDWDSGILTLAGRGEEQQLALQPGTQDRLSYLLLARRLAASGEGREQVRIASLDAAEDGLLQVRGREPVEVPLGRYDAVAVQRVTPDPGELRTLWFDPAFSPLPLRVVHDHEGQTAEMQLERFSQTPAASGRH